MLRGGVFIGVTRTGGREVLRAAASDARQMYRWAVDPHFGAMRPENVRILTDAGNKPVTVASVSTAVREVIDAGVDQLILYYSGHGVMVGFDETWLLSGAPEDGNEAISVPASERHASVGSTPHVVIISDACRVPSNSYETQALRSASAFPNVVRGRQRVDVFYSCAPAQVALETTTSPARGIYSAVLYDALCAVLYDVGGAQDSVLQAGDPDDGCTYILPEPLAVYLEAAVSAQLIAMNLDIDQSPDVRSSGTTRNRRWLARFEDDGAARSHVRQASSGDRTLAAAAGPPVRTITQTALELITAVDQGRPLTPLLDQLRREGAAGLADSVTKLIAASEAAAGIFDKMTVVGAQITRSFGLGGLPGTVDPPLRVRSVVVELSNGTAMALPILQGYRTVVTVLDDEAPDVAFVPTIGPPRPEAERAAARRAIVSAAARRGRFSVAADLVTDRSGSGSFDPTFTVYAAHADAPLMAEEEFSGLADTVRSRLGGVSLFDVAARAGVLPGPIVPAVPLLIHGWDLPYTTSIVSARYLDTLRRAVRPTLWTTFDASAFDLLAEIALGEGNR